MADTPIQADPGSLSGSGSASLILEYILTAEAGSISIEGEATVALQYVLTAEAGEIEVNKASAGFGSFVSSVPETMLYFLRADGRYVTGDEVLVTIDTVEGSNYNRAISPEYSFSRIAVVENLNPSSDLNTVELYQSAVDAVKKIVGGLGSSYRGMATPTYLEKFTPELMGDGVHAAKVKIDYRSYPLPQYKFNTVLGSIDTNIEWGNDDEESQNIEISYLYPIDYKLDSRKAGQLFTQGGTVSMPIGETTITVSFTVASGYVPTLVIDGEPIRGIGSSATSIMTALSLFAGCVNETAYAVGCISGAAREWIFENVSGSSNDGGRTYQASMTLRYKPGGIEQQVTYINPDDGKPPADIEEGHGYYTPEVAHDCIIPSFLFSNPNIWTYGEWTWA